MALVRVGCKSTSATRPMSRPRLFPGFAHCQPAPQLSFLFSAPRLQRTLLFSSSSDRVAQMLSRRPGGRRVVSDAAAHPVQHLPLALGHKVLGGDGAPTANPRTLSLACHRCTARSGQRVLACRTWARCFRHRHLQWVGAPAVRVVMRRVEYSTGAPLFCAKHDSRAVSAITGRCSAASHTGLCPCTQRPVRHRDPGRVDACIVPPPPSLPECRAAAPLAPSSLVLIPARTRLVQSRGMAMPQQGTGTHTFGDGTYTGEWCGGKRHGQGVMVLTSGDRCVRHAGGCAGG